MTTIREQIADDIHDERGQLLDWVVRGVSAAGLVLFVTMLSGGTLALESPLTGVLLLGWVVLAVTLIVSHQLRRFNRNYSASLACLWGLTIALGILLWYAELRPEALTLMLLPAALAGLLLEGDDLWMTGGFVIVVMYAAAALRSNIFQAVPVVLAPALVCLVLIVSVYNKVHSLLERLAWATDIQSKDTRRAESFFDKNEELQKALLQVQFYSSRLETLNAQLAEAQQRADRASNAKSIFLSNMSHELRTPLNVIIGYSSSMLTMPHMFNDTPLPEVYQPFLKLIEENGHYLVGLINDTLDLSKIEAGKVELQCAPVDITEICRGVIATSVGLLKNKPIQIRSDFPDNLPLVYADSMRVRQIILNLMSNAVKFTDTGSITLSAEVLDGFVYLSVTDTGIGIPEDAQAVIFDRFQQAERNTERKYGGTGLGLDISKQLSLMHGGDLTVRSEVGKGSTFTLSLPVATDVNGAVELSPYSEEGIRVFAPTTALSEPHMIVLAEDESGTRQMVQQALESAGHAVVTTRDGKDALELVEGLLPALVILDVFLPDMNGWDVLRHLRSNPETARIPVIVCTHDRPHPDLALWDDCEYLPKPVKPDALLRRVEQVLAKPVAIPA